MNTMMMHRRASFALVASLAVFSSCEYGGKDEEKKQDLATLLWVALAPEGLALNGGWADPYAAHDIQASKTAAGGASGHWNQSGSGNTTYATVVEFDNGSRVLYKDVTGCTVTGWCTTGYSRVVWAYSGGNLYVCDVNYGKATLAEAKADPTTVDSTSPGTGGCGSYTWTQMTAQ